MINQLTVLILLSAIFYAGTSLRHFALAGDGCNDCNCSSDECCEDEEKEKQKSKKADLFTLKLLFKVGPAFILINI